MKVWPKRKNLNFKIEGGASLHPQVAVPYSGSRYSTTNYYTPSSLRHMASVYSAFRAFREYNAERRGRDVRQREDG